TNRTEYSMSSISNEVSVKPFESV
ncbi:hypothetical protein D021_0107B, partial [Vibrio parahaemolyticus 10296]